jgi:hypothetical protein
MNVIYAVGRSITQAVNHEFLTVEARLRSQVRSYDICREQSGTEAGFL